MVHRRESWLKNNTIKERREERGRPSNKRFQWTSGERGRPELLMHLGLQWGAAEAATMSSTNFTSNLTSLRRRIPIIQPHLMTLRIGKFLHYLLVSNFSHDPRSGLVHVLLAVAGFDPQNKVPA
jgi:hypothetical protein